MADQIAQFTVPDALKIRDALRDLAEIKRRLGIGNDSGGRKGPRGSTSPQPEPGVWLQIYDATTTDTAFRWRYSVDVYATPSLTATPIVSAKYAYNIQELGNGDDSAGGYEIVSSSAVCGEVTGIEKVNEKHGRWAKAIALIPDDAGDLFYWFSLPNVPIVEGPA